MNRLQKHWKAVVCAVALALLAPWAISQTASTYYKIVRGNHYFPDEVNLNELVVDADGSFSLDATVVTATGAELNALAGTGLSATEMGYLNGVTAGTVTASKAVVVDASKGVDDLTVDDLSMGLSYIYEDGAVAVYGATSIDATTNTIEATLADGTNIGDMKLVVCSDGSNATTMTVAHHETEDAEALLFDTADEYWLGAWTGTEWVTVSMTATAP